MLNKHKVKHHRNSDTKTANRDHIRTTALERSVMNYCGASTSITCPYYIHTASLSGSYYVHQVSTKFLPRAYHAHPVSSTLLLRSQHNQADRTTRLPHFQHVLTAYSLLLYRNNFFTTTNTNTFNRMSFILIDRGK